MAPLLRIFSIFTITALALFFLYRSQMMSSPPPAPTPTTGSPRIQATFPSESIEDRQIREARRETIKSTFTKSWMAYNLYADLSKDENPFCYRGVDHFDGGWPRITVPALDTLWIMGMENEFKETVEVVRELNFTEIMLGSDRVDVLLTTTRYLGGLLGAYEVSGMKEWVLLKKATELGDLLMGAWESWHGLPYIAWSFKDAINGTRQRYSSNRGQDIITWQGSLALEFTRLSQLTGEQKYFEAVQRITDVLENAQDKTKIPGLWPDYSLSGLIDYSDGHGFELSTETYTLQKQHMLQNVEDSRYKRMYIQALEIAKKRLFFAPMTNTNKDFVFTTKLRLDNPAISQWPAIRQQSIWQRDCSLGGILATGSRLFNRPEDLDVARRMTDGYVWAYKSTRSGLMAPWVEVVSCGPGMKKCEWDESVWRDAVLPLPREKWDSRWTSYSETDPDVFIDRKIEAEGLGKGLSDLRNPYYYLSPQLIESIFILYRITGDPSLPDAAWDLFQTINKHSSHPQFGNVGLQDIRLEHPAQSDFLPTGWLEGTLKYFYLMFSEPSVYSLDEWVFNLVGHPLRTGVLKRR